MREHTEHHLQTTSHLALFFSGTESEFDLGQDTVVYSKAHVQRATVLLEKYAKRISKIYVDPCTSSYLFDVSAVSERTLLHQHRATLQSIVFHPANDDPSSWMSLPWQSPHRQSCLSSWGTTAQLGCIKLQKLVVNLWRPETRQLLFDGLTARKWPDLVALTLSNVSLHAVDFARDMEPGLRCAATNVRTLHFFDCDAKIRQSVLNMPIWDCVEELVVDDDEPEDDIDDDILDIEFLAGSCWRNLRRIALLANIPVRRERRPLRLSLPRLTDLTLYKWRDWLSLDAPALSCMLVVHEVSGTFLARLFSGSFPRLCDVQTSFNRRRRASSLRSSSHRSLHVAHPTCPGFRYLVLAVADLVLLESIMDLIIDGTWKVPQLKTLSLCDAKPGPDGPLRSPERIRVMASKTVRFLHRLQDTLVFFELLGRSVLFHDVSDTPCPGTGAAGLPSAVASSSSCSGSSTTTHSVSTVSWPTVRAPNLVSMMLQRTSPKFNNLLFSHLHAPNLTDLNVSRIAGMLMQSDTVDALTQQFPELRKLYLSSLLQKLPLGAHPSREPHVGIIPVPPATPSPSRHLTSLALSVDSILLSLGKIILSCGPSLTTLMLICHNADTMSPLHSLFSDGPLQHLQRLHIGYHKRPSPSACPDSSLVIDAIIQCPRLRYMGLDVGQIDGNATPTHLFTMLRDSSELKIHRRVHGCLVIMSENQIEEIRLGVLYHMGATPASACMEHDFRLDMSNSPT
jgi:hypothetical protein